MGEAENLDAQVPDELRPGINRDPIPVERGCLGLRFFIAAPEDLYLAPGTSRASGFEFTIRDTHVGDFTTGVPLSARCGLGLLEIEQEMLARDRGAFPDRAIDMGAKFGSATMTPWPSASRHRAFPFAVGRGRPNAVC